MIWTNHIESLLCGGICNSISHSDYQDSLTGWLIDWKFTVPYFFSSHTLDTNWEGVDWIDVSDWIDWIDWIYWMDWIDWVD